MPVAEACMSALLLVAAAANDAPPPDPAPPPELLLYLAEFDEDPVAVDAALPPETTARDDGKDRDARGDHEENEDDDAPR